MVTYHFFQTKTRVQHLQDQYRAIQQGITEFSVPPDTGTFMTTPPNSSEDQISTRATVSIWTLVLELYNTSYIVKASTKNDQSCRHSSLLLNVFRVTVGIWAISLTTNINKCFHIPQGCVNTGIQGTQEAVIRSDEFKLSNQCKKIKK